MHCTVTGKGKIAKMISERHYSLQLVHTKTVWSLQMWGSHFWAAGVCVSVFLAGNTSFAWAKAVQQHMAWASSFGSWGIEIELFGEVEEVETSEPCQYSV